MFNAQNGVCLKLALTSVMEIMKCKMKKGVVVISRYSSGELRSKNYLDKYRENLGELKSLEKEFRLQEGADDLEKIFAENDGWGELFSTYISGIERNDAFGFQQEFIIQINIDKCIAAIKTGTVKDLHYFRMAIYSIFDVPGAEKAFGDYVEKITKLKDALDFETDSIMKRLQLKLLREFFERMLKSVAESKSGDDKSV